MYTLWYDLSIGGKGGKRITARKLYNNLLCFQICPARFRSEAFRVTISCMRREIALEDFIKGIPKAELHLHIEGTFEPELMFKIAGRNNVNLKYTSIEEIREAYRFSSL